MRLVITGALGHIGSHLIRVLPAEWPGAEVLLVDNLSTQRFASLFNLPPGAAFRFIEADVTRADLPAIVDGADVVVHLAAITDAAGSFDRAEEIEANNFEGTARMARACAASGARLIALSSTSVYGTQAAVVAEDCGEDELKPQSPYARTKLREEACVRELCETAGLRAVSFRFGTIFGASPGMRFHTAVNKFCWQAVFGQPITVWRTALHQKRPYLDLHDAARAIAFAIRQDLFDGRVYNVLTVNATVGEVVDAIRGFVPDLQVEFVDSRIMNQLSYEVSCERMRAHGFEAHGDLQRGVGDTISLLRGANGRVCAASPVS